MCEGGERERERELRWILKLRFLYVIWCLFWLMSVEVKRVDGGFK